MSHVGLLQGVPLSELPSKILSLIGAALFLIGNWRLWREIEERSDELLEWIGTGCMVAAFAQVGSSFLRDHSVAWLQPITILYALMVFVWAWGAIDEIRTYWSAIADSSRRDAQRKVAFDLHDGIAQEVALFTSYLRASPEERTSPSGTCTSNKRPSGPWRIFDEQSAFSPTWTPHISRPISSVSFEMPSTKIRRFTSRSRRTQCSMSEALLSTIRSNELCESNL